MAESTATVLVCTTCRMGLPSEEGVPRPGARLLDALAAEEIPEGVEVRGVECMSACSTGCTVALRGDGKWTYVYGRMDPDAHAPQIAEGIRAYAASADGIVPWRERVEIFRKQSIARIPPLEIPQ